METLTSEQAARKAEEMLRKLRGKLSKGPRKRPGKPIPAGATELFPGGPSQDTGDIQIVRRRGRQRPERTA